MGRQWIKGTHSRMGSRGRMKKRGKGRADKGNAYNKATRISVLKLEINTNMMLVVFLSVLSTPQRLWRAWCVLLLSCFLNRTACCWIACEPIMISRGQRIANVFLQSFEIFFFYGTLPLCLFSRCVVFGTDSDSPEA